MTSFLVNLFMGLLLPKMGFSQDPGLIVIGKIKPFDFLAQPKLHPKEILPKSLLDVKIAYPGASRPLIVLDCLKTIHYRHYLKHVLALPPSIA